MVIRFTVSAAEDGQRLDAVVSAHLDGASRRATRTAFAAGRVLCDGHHVSKGQRATAGSIVEVLEQVAPRPLPASQPLTIVYETEELVIVDKPWGQPTVSRDSDAVESLAAQLLERYPNTRGIGFRPEESGLVSRLDTATSGLVICAKSPEAFAALRSPRPDAKLTKTYDAIVHWGDDLRAGPIECELGPHKTNPRKVAVGKAIRGKPVTTRTELLEIQHWGQFALLTLRLTRGYRHQIRAHLALLGHPLVGDTLYGGSSDFPRHALHAQRVTWLGTDALPSFDVAVPLAADLTELLGRR